jgi:hypothetical protein
MDSVTSTRLDTFGTLKLKHSEAVRSQALVPAESGHRGLYLMPTYGVGLVDGRWDYGMRGA